MFLGALGDIHGEFDTARAIVARHPEVPFWLCVGDVADEHGRYEPLGAPVYWIHGNNDNLDAIASGDLPPNLHHLPNATVVRPGPWPSALPTDSPRICGLGGTFAPTWYDTRAADLPHPRKSSAKATELADKRRHFVRDEVETCKSLRHVDVLLTHEAAKPFRPFPGGRGPDAGKAQINEILAAMRPRLHLFGHHHRLTDELREEVRSVGLDLVVRSYVLIDAVTLDISVQSL